MEAQVRKAIYCELRKAIKLVHLGRAKNTYLGTDVTTDQDQPLPDNWGAQITLTFMVDEKTTLNPGLSLLTPMHSAPVNFVGETIGATGLVAANTFTPLSFPQSYSFGLGGTVAADASRYDKFYSYYTIGELGTTFSDNDVCHKTNEELRISPDSTSTPLIEGNLGIYDWLVSAALSNNFLRSSRAAPNGEGVALTSGNFGADSISFDIKFVLRTEGNVTPTWKLVRVAANTGSSFFDTFRERTHEVQITIGPGATTKVKTSRGSRELVVAGPSSGAAALHQAGQIGSAVANSLRSQ
jgi:hypothetical protein